MTNISAILKCFEIFCCRFLLTEDLFTRKIKVLNLTLGSSEFFFFFFALCHIFKQRWWRNPLKYVNISLSIPYTKQYKSEI